MNVSVVFGFLLAVFIAFASALPAKQELPQEESTLQEEEIVEPAQVDDTEPADLGAKFTNKMCSLLGVSLPFGSLNDAACSAHCMMTGKGYRGGSCKNGVCYCRK